MSVYRISQFRPWSDFAVLVLVLVLSARGWWIAGFALFVVYGLAVFVLLRCPRCYWWVSVRKLFPLWPSNYWAPRNCPHCGLDLTSHRPFGPPRKV